MGDFLKLALSVYLFSLAFSAFSGVLRFFVDIKRFKDNEEKFQTEEDFENDIVSAAEIKNADDLVAEEKGVSADARTDTELNTPIIF